MTRHGRFLTRRQVAMMIDAVDINDDGEIDYSEFLVSSLIQPYKKPRPKTNPVIISKIKMLVCRRILRMKAVEIEA